MKILVASSAKEYSAIWRYAFEINRYFRKKNEVTWLDLYEKNNFSRVLKLFRKPKENYDVSILTSPLLGGLISKANKLNIVIVHDIYPVSSGKGTPAAVKILAGNLYKKLKRADCLLFVSEFSRKEFEETFPFRVKSHVIHGGVDHSVFKPSAARNKARGRYKIPAGKFLLCHVGSDEYRKNFAFVLGVFRKLLEKGVDAHLVKVGRMVNDYKLDSLKDRITLIDSATDKELAGIYQMSDALLFPSLHEGLGLPPIEAMACGCPAIVSDKGALPEAGLKECVTELDAGKWADKLVKMKNSPSYRNALIKKGIRKAKSFDWQAYCKSLERIISHSKTLKSVSAD